jgi:hypothetical protein
MKLIELRILNFVETQAGNIIPCTFQTIEAIYHNRGIYNFVPLTDEWFTKFGFFKDGDFWSKGINDYKYCFKYRDWAKNWAFYQEFTDSPNPEDEGKKYPISFDIEYVHQLQNLWFSLTHQEITIKNY